MYGLIAEFDNPEALVAAAHRAFAEGFRKMDAYSPFPVEGLAEALGFHRRAGAQRLADALSPGFQCGTVRAGEPQSIFSLDRGRRSEVRFGGDAEIPRKYRISWSL